MPRCMYIAPLPYLPLPIGAKGTILCLSFKARLATTFDSSVYTRNIRLYASESARNELYFLGGFHSNYCRWKMLISI